MPSSGYYVNCILVTYQLVAMSTIGLFQKFCADLSISVRRQIVFRFFTVSFVLHSSIQQVHSETETMVADRPHLNFDDEYPRTAVMRMMNVRQRTRSLTTQQLSGDWAEVRRKLLWAGGLKDLSNARPGQGYTGHSFNDFNHCDLNTMLGEVAHNNNEGRVPGIALNNQLGPGIQIASLEELGPGGSWSTCMMGCNREPPQDVAHIQFKSRIAFKLVW